MFINSIKAFFSSCLYSKTMWFNTIIAALLALEPVFGLLQTVLPGNVYAWSSIVLTVGNAILRIVTTQPLLSK